MSIKNKNRFAFIIPVYNHTATVAQVVKYAQALRFPIFVVDDGSTDKTYDQIKEIAGIHIMRHQQNQGKGAAIMTGFAAASAGADIIVTGNVTESNDAKQRVSEIICAIKGIKAN